MNWEKLHEIEEKGRKKALLDYRRSLLNDAMNNIEATKRTSKEDAISEHLTEAGKFLEEAIEVGCYLTKPVAPKPLEGEELPPP